MNALSQTAALPVSGPARPQASSWTEGRLLQTVRTLFSKAEYRPPILPDIAMRVMELSRREADVGQLVSLLERDAMLAGRVLKMAQSAYYATLMPVTSLKQAVIRLGQSTMHQIVLEAAANLRVFRASSYVGPMERVRQHSTAVAHLTLLTCRRTMVSAEQGFLAGLLHDLGLAACLTALSDAPSAEKPVDLDALWPVMGRVHEEAGAIVAAAWKLPTEVRDVVSLHHELSHAPAPLVAVVSVAETLAIELGAALHPGPTSGLDGDAALAADVQSPRVMKQMAASIGLADAQVAELRVEGKALLQKLSRRL